MVDTIQKRLDALGIVLPAAVAPAANYVPFVQSGKLILTAGQLPFQNGTLTATGLVGRDVNLDDAKAAARQCAINVLAQLKAATGDLELLTRLVKITVFVASVPSFTEQHLVANGASDLLVEALGERGKHARSAVGVACLPLNAPVEVEAIAEVG